METLLYRCRKLVFSGLMFTCAGLASCTLSDISISQETPLGPQDPPLPFSMGKGEMQFVRLSRPKNVRPDYAQVLAGEDGSVYVFWQEKPTGENVRPQDYLTNDYQFRRRFPDGSWDVEERIENSELNFDPVFLWDDHHRPCFTFYKDSDSGELWLSCREAGGWTETSYSGYADLISSGFSIFLDPPRIVTAYVAHESGVGYLYFGKTRLAEGLGDISDPLLAMDGAGNYLLAFSIQSPDRGDIPLIMMESMDKGITWSQPVEITRENSGPEQFFLAQDGTLYLAWVGARTVVLMHRSPGSEWETTVVPLGSRYDFIYDDVFLGQSPDGLLWIAIRSQKGIYRLKGTIQKGFSDPVQLYEMDSDWWIIDFTATFGGDGSLFVTGMAKKGFGNTAEYVVFGWI
jgi:hypothetical protein